LYEKQGCPKCKRSHGETKIASLLSIMDIDYITEYRFPDLFGVGNRKTLLPFDFYIPSMHICIEYDGKQHFQKTSKYYSKNLILNDQLKDDYCKRNNIRLLRIKYSDFDNIKKILTRYLFD
jgi:very-short-patch-repair endonuclease